MKKISIEESKKVQLNILLKVADFCERNNIRYFLIAGTLLGAIRHKGFIPWDDDIDIAMPRKDYNKFIKKFSYKDMVVKAWDNDSKFLCTYAKVSNENTLVRENVDFGIDIGINIDVFPIDGLPNNKFARKYYLLFMKMMWKLVACATIKNISKRSLLKKIFILFLKKLYKLGVSKSYITGLTVKLAQKYNFDGSQKVGCVVWGYGDKEEMDGFIYTKYMKKSFEGYLFNVPIEYDIYLKKIYGEYMKYPPLNEQIYKHGLIAYWK